MPTEQQLITQAVADGYPDVDEACSLCARVFKNYHHMLRCDEAACPMKDGKGTFLERWAAELERETAKGSAEK